MMPVRQILIYQSIDESLFTTKVQIKVQIWFFKLFSNQKCTAKTFPDDDKSDSANDRSLWLVKAYRNST